MRVLSNPKHFGRDATKKPHRHHAYTTSYTQCLKALRSQTARKDNSGKVNHRATDSLPSNTRNGELIYSTLVAPPSRASVDAYYSDCLNAPNSSSHSNHEPRFYLDITSKREATSSTTMLAWHTTHPPPKEANASRPRINHGSPSHHFPPYNHLPSLCVA